MRLLNRGRIVNICLLLIGIAGVIIATKFSGNDIGLNSVYKEIEETHKANLAMYIEDSAGNYVEYDQNNFPSGYVLNVDKSKCLDLNNNVVDGALSQSENSVNITVNATVSCSLYFDKIEVSSVVVSISANYGGSVNPTTQVVAIGDTASIEIQPNKGYRISMYGCGEFVNSSLSDNVITIENVTSDINCTVNFEEIPLYTVTMTSNDTSLGTVEHSTQEMVEEGGSAYFIVQPARGYCVDSYTCGSKTMTYTPPAGFERTTISVDDVSKDLNCIVNFKRQPVAVHIFHCVLWEEFDTDMDWVDIGSDAVFELVTSADGYVFSSTNCPGGTVSDNILTIPNITNGLQCKVNYRTPS